MNSRTSKKISRVNVDIPLIDCFETMMEAFYGENWEETYAREVLYGKDKECEKPTTIESVYSYGWFGRLSKA